MATARLLLVDDEDNLRSMLEAALRHSGFEVHPVANGRDAIAAVPEVRPDLIVLDVMLPDLDGFDVCKRLRSGGDRTPVLFLTARDATEDKVRGLTLGRRRLPREALQPRGAGGAHHRRAAAVGPGPRGGRAPVRRPRHGRRRPPRHQGRARGEPLAHRVQPPALPAR